MSYATAAALADWETQDKGCSYHPSCLACPHCHGTLYHDADPWGERWVCLICGREQQGGTMVEFKRCPLCGRRILRGRYCTSCARVTRREQP